jgi:hypothetical protein
VNQDHLCQALEAMVRAVRLALMGELGRSLPSGQAVACRALLPPWSPGLYQIGDRRVHAGQVWRCCQGHDSRQDQQIVPGQAPAHWAADHAADARWALPYAQPAGAHDAYAAGDYILWRDGETYRCRRDGCAHDPDADPQGWEPVRNP